MKVIESLGNALERSLIVICSMALMSIVIGICVDVFVRYFFGFSIAAIDELSAILWVWIVYLLVGVVTRRGRNLVADFISIKYSKKVDRLLKLATHFLFLGFSAVFGWFSVQVIRMYIATGTKPPTQLGMPEWIARFCLIPGFVLMFFYTLELLIAMFSHRKASGLKPGES